jgi:hypothetical protein
MISILIAIGLGLLTLAFVLYPLYHRTPPSEQVSTASKVSEDSSVLPSEREQAARAALHEVELDYQLGNISNADYGTLRERYMRRALSALKTRYEHEQELDEAIEEELKKLKERSGDGTE